MTAEGGVGAAYDAIASQYDAAVAEEAWMRRLLWRHHERLFPPGSRVLDLACGTGIDTLHHARRGVRMTAVDLSIGMLSRLAAKARAEGGAARVTIAACDLDRLTLAPSVRFDGMISSFAGLNTLADPPRFAAEAAARLAPGGRLVGHFLSPHDLWRSPRSPSPDRAGAAPTIETGGAPTEIGRKTVAIAGREVVHHVLPAEELYRRWFSAAFELAGAYSLGFLWPHSWSARLPGGLAATLGRLEPFLGRGRGLAWGRFTVLELAPR